MISTNKYLYDILRKLKPTGPDGFEGLIALLLESLTGRHFFLSKSGFQGGRDMSTDSRNTNIIAIECKRYHGDTELNERELLGEIQQVSWDIPGLDLWILVASRDIDDQLEKSIFDAAREKGFEAIIIDTVETNSDQPSSLAAICANSSAVFIHFLQENIPGIETSELKEILTAIEKQAKYHDIISKLRNDFSSSIVGYDNWRITQNNWLLDRFRSESESRSAFGSAVINVLDDKVRLVSRKPVYKKIYDWLDTWKEHTILCLLGDEGDGKTWAIACWLSECIRHNKEFPSVIFLTSSRISLTTDPQKFLANAISQQLREFDAEYWEKRLDKWKHRPESDKPLIILILDGINERYDFNWRDLFDKLDVSPWKERIAVILTCRTITWGKKYSHLSHLKVQQLVIPPFDNMELTNALSQHHLKLSDIQQELLPLIRKPRYLDLVIKYRQVMSESGDITVERLLYEDWKDYTSRKSGIPLGHNEFHALIRDLAEKTQSGSKAFSERDIENLLPANLSQIVQELISSGILIPDNLQMGKYKVESSRLIHGFGLLLKEEVSKAIQSKVSAEEREERIAQLLEPHRDMDIKVKICAAAVLHAVMDRNFPEEGRFVLFQAWFIGRNLDDTDQESITAYLPLCPETYVRLAEFAWSDVNDNSTIQTIFMKGFLKWRESRSLQTILPSVLTRWMGFINIHGFSIQRGVAREKKEEIRQKIEDSLGIKLQIGLINVAGYDFAVIEDDGLLRLARVALAIISHCKRMPFIKAFVTWSMSRTIMGHPNEYELVSWVLKTIKENIWEQFKTEVNDLISKNTLIAHQAAYRLLSCYGSTEAYQLRQTLPENLFPPNPFYELYLKDPCSQTFFLWNRKDYQNCLNRADLTPYHIALSMKDLSLEPLLVVPINLRERLEGLESEFIPDALWKTMGITAEDHKLRQIEPTLAAFAPHTLANIMKSVVRDASNREDIALRQLSLIIRLNLIILKMKELGAIEPAWHKLIDKKGNWNEPERIAEEFLFFAILYSLSAKEQLDTLLSRPDSAADLFQYKCLFKPLESSETEDILKYLATINGKIRLRRILWFLSANPDVISLEAFKYIISFFDYPDTTIRGLVLELLYKSNNKDLIRDVVNSKWAWTSKDCFGEDYWGSLILSEFGASLPYREIRSRVHPIFLGYAVEKRGLIESEVAQFAQDINKIWENIILKSPSVPESFPASEIKYNCDQEISLREPIGISSSAFSTSYEFISRDSFWGGHNDPSKPKIVSDIFKLDTSERLKHLTSILQETIKQQLAAGNVLFSNKFYKNALHDVVKIHPDLVKRWLQPICNNTEDSHRTMTLCQSFYEALLTVLFENKHCEALKLLDYFESFSSAIKFVDSETGIRCLDFYLLKCHNNKEIKYILDTRLERCSSDLELFELALIIQLTGNINWLKHTIEQGLNSPWYFEQARAIVLIGFFEDKNGDSMLLKYCGMPQSWITTVAEKALDYYKKNLWAKQWFNKFLNDEDDEVVWACFKLFLKCVDRRYWIWENDFLNDSYKDNMEQKRLKFLSLNRDEIKKSIKENEKKRSETFLGEKMLKNQAWPWMNSIFP